ncbi:MAG TPA: BON domain-containing protein [Longimicrobiales bacterium]
MKRGETFLLGFAMGAGLTYLLDPDRGGRRRALVRDQLVHAGHEAEVVARSTARHVRNRARGLAHEARARLTEHEVDDRVLEERVRSEIGRKLSHGDIEVTASHGHVTLAGSVIADDLQDVVRAARGVRGVESLDNRLAAQSGSADVQPTSGS